MNDGDVLFLEAGCSDFFETEAIMYLRAGYTTRCLSCGREGSE